MTQLHRLNAIQNELRDALSLNQDDYRLEVERNEIGAHFIGLHLRSVFQPIQDLGMASRWDTRRCCAPAKRRGVQLLHPLPSAARKRWNGWSNSTGCAAPCTC